MPIDHKGVQYRDGLFVGHLHSLSIFGGCRASEHRRRQAADRCDRSLTPSGRGLSAAPLLEVGRVEMWRGGFR
jgi:hypothetical protein